MVAGVSVRSLSGSTSAREPTNRGRDGAISSRQTGRHVGKALESEGQGRRGAAGLWNTRRAQSGQGRRWGGRGLGERRVQRRCAGAVDAVGVARGEMGEDLLDVLSDAGVVGRRAGGDGAKRLKDNTQCRMGCSGRTCSTRWAAVSAMRRTPQLGQNPRRLQLNATSFSWRQASHLTRRNPYSRRPHFRYASNDSMTKWGSETPSASSRWRNRGKCSSTRAWSGACSGR